MTTIDLYKNLSIKYINAGSVVKRNNSRQKLSHREIVVVPVKTLYRTKKLDQNGEIVDATSGNRWVVKYDISDINSNPYKYYVTCSNDTSIAPCVVFLDSEENVIQTTCVGSGEKLVRNKEQVYPPSESRYILLMANTNDIYPELRVDIDVDGVEQYETSDAVAATQTMNKSYINSSGEITESSSSSNVVRMWDISNIENIKYVVVSARVGATTGVFACVFKSGDTVKGVALESSGTQKIWIDCTIEVPDGTAEVYLSSNTSYLSSKLKTKTLVV